MSFDRLAPHYLQLERVLAGDVLQQARTAHLDELRTVRRALLLGEGPGRFLGELLRVNPTVQVTVVDRSPRMLAVARKGVGLRDLVRVRFEVHDLLASWVPESGAHDLIATHCFLDCFRRSQLEVLIPKIARGASSDARWVITDFCEPAGGWRRLRARMVLWLMYRVFRLVTRLPATGLTPPEPYLESAGFQLRTRRLAYHDMIHADVWVKRDPV
jgi:ubiquinone/menaquinone biosynthesis C-methylase UbiE